MGGETRTSVTIVNGNYPPMPGVTGESASELAWYLENYGSCDVSIVTLTTGYQGGGGSRDAAGEVHKVKSFYGGKKKLPRLVNSLFAGRALIKKAKSLNSEWTIVMTDPILLSMWAALLLKDKNWILWSMDLYPEALFASGLIGRDGWIGRKLLKWTYSSLPSAIISLGPGQSQYLRSVYASKTLEMPIFELPCGLFVDEDSGNGELPEWGNPEKVTFGYVGNIGEAHDLEFVKEVIKNLDPELHQFILSTYGAKSTELIAFASKFPVVQQTDRVSRDDLKYIDVHLATLESHWTHVCVPSKVVSAVCAGSTFFLKADEKGDNWRLLSGAGVLFENRDDVSQAIQRSIDLTDFHSLSEMAKLRRIELLKAKAETFQELRDFLLLRTQVSFCCNLLVNNKKL